MNLWIPWILYFHFIQSKWPLCIIRLLYLLLLHYFILKLFGAAYLFRWTLCWVVTLQQWKGFQVEERSECWWCRWATAMKWISIHFKPVLIRFNIHQRELFGVLPCSLTFCCVACTGLGSCNLRAQLIRISRLILRCVLVSAVEDTHFFVVTVTLHKTLLCFHFKTSRSLRQTWPCSEKSVKLLD